MIPLSAIVEWRHQAPWIYDSQIEQDLVISRALVALYQQPKVASSLAFRGGTALHKLFMKPSARYSEDIDLVQIKPEPIGPTIEAIREALDHWLGAPKWKQKQGRVTLYYQFLAEAAPYLPQRLKIEINTEEHFSIFGLNHIPYQIESSWFSGETQICTFQFDELIGTKLRALYQRKKGRDLFDLWLALQDNSLNVPQVIHIFQAYMKHQNKQISRAQFESNLAGKLLDPDFGKDMELLLATTMKWDMGKEVHRVQEGLISKLPGGAWKANRKS